MNFALRPGAIHFLGFTAASLVFDFSTKALGYKRYFSLGGLPAVAIAVFSTWIAGLIIWGMFIPTRDIVIFPLLHAVGGLIGSVLGLVIVKGLEIRGISPLERTG